LELHSRSVASEVNVTKSYSLPEYTIIDGGSMVHVFPSEPDNFKPGINRGARQLIFGNDKQLPIDGVGSVGSLRDVMICNGMSKGILSAVKLATDNNMVSISTSEGLLILKSGEAPILRPDQILYWVELKDGLYRAPTSSLLASFCDDGKA